MFLLVHAQGLRLRPRVGATLEAESGTNDPFAIFLTLMLVEYISLGSSSPGHVLMEFVQEAVLGAIVYRIALESAVQTAERQKEKLLGALAAGDGPIAG